MEIKIVVDEQGQLNIFWPKTQLPLATMLGILDLAHQAIMDESRHPQPTIQQAQNIPASVLARLRNGG